jgi:serine protease Do
MSRLMNIALAGASLAAASVMAGGFDLRRGFSDVAKEATPAVVFIQVEKSVPMNGQIFFNNPFDLFGDDFQERFFGIPNGGNQSRRLPSRNRQQMFRQTGQGSGFLISKDGYILTNTHVVGDVDKITVKLNDGREFTAKRIGADPKTEVALIKIDTDKDLPFLKAGDPQELLTGEWVIAIGNPFGLKETLTVGVVSAKGRSGMGITDYEDFIQTDAAINPGNSGGPLLNVDGEVVGINTAIYSRNGGYMGIGFAVPIDMAMHVKDQLLTTGKVTRGYVGVLLNPGELTEGLASAFGSKQNSGVLIAEVVKDGPADKAGIKEGDIITKLNGKEMKSNTEFRNDVAQIMPKEKAQITLMRDGKEKTVTVTLAAYPDDGDTAAAGAESPNAESVLDKLGLDLQELTPEIASQLGIEGQKHGLVVTDVAAGSAAEEAGLKEGMVIVEVNRSEVKSVNDFKKSVSKSKGTNILLRVKTQQGSFFTSLALKN